MAKNNSKINIQQSAIANPNKTVFTITKLTCFILLLSFTPLFSQLSGTLTDKNQTPLSNCTVSLNQKNLKENLTSSSFTLGAPTHVEEHRVTYNYSLNNSVFSLSLANPSQITLDIRDVAGRRVGTSISKKLNSGTHQFAMGDLAKSTLSNRVYILNLRINQKEERILFLKESSQIVSASNGSDSPTLLKKGVDVLDTLEVQCKEYTPRSIEVKNYDADLGNIVMHKIPNILVIFVDDLGYNDLGIYNSKAKAIRTPNIDKLAKDGIHFTDWQSANSVCGPSRGSLLTGRLPPRNGYPVVSHVQSALQTKHLGLQQDQITIPEVLKPLGYKTAVFGKWHMGYGHHHLPLRHGFDEYMGVLGNFPISAKKMIYEGDSPTGENIRFEHMHQRLTNRTMAFMDSSKKEDKPFFIYLSHYLAHGPWEPSRKFATDAEWNARIKNKGQINQIAYAPMIRELDWHVGEVLNKLDSLDITDNTLVFFTSDNGPWLQSNAAKSAGSAWPLRGSKFNTFEGGHRVPGIVRYPNMIPAGQKSDELVSTMDIFATILNTTGASIPKDYKIDGKDITPILRGDKEAKTPHDVLAGYTGINLQTVRKGKWKLHLPRSPGMMPFYADKSWGRGSIDDLKEPLLYNLEDNIEENINLSKAQPEVLTDLLKEADKIRKELGDWGVEGTDRHDFNGMPLQHINKRP